ncbi:peroxiredoxin [Dysgonomonas sp. 520]|uniref:peroxiredoxin family protein n=1 Tax=Dysgonomonas sp. 520 TaxID=2302931 RepID=UPI0013D39734|nr:redoxin domain-containing protein [Dysgonomonas sp. 520]NDW08768.1 hypothetical protein [Dysgonomonas sp. 520]
MTNLIILLYDQYMTKQQLYLLAILFSCAVGLNAQTVSLDFAKHADKDVSLCLKFGTTNDTIYQGRLDDQGKAKVTLPKEYASYRGMASLKTGQSTLDFIVAEGENLTIRCHEEFIHGGNAVFINSPENEFLQRSFMDQAVRQQKIGLLSQMERVYKTEDALFPVLEKEKKSLEAEQQSFEKELKSNKLYASRFLELHNFLSREVSMLVYGDSLRMARTRKYLTDSLDLNSLFTSGLWFNVLNGSLALYDNKTSYHKDFITDMSLLLKRSDSDRIYHTLSENLFAICETMGWNDLEEQLAYFLINDGRIKEPTGKLLQLMTLFKLKKGNQAPKLSFGDFADGKVLLVFYESGCGPCENEMQQLGNNYPILKEKGYEVISISADTDEQIFRNTAQTYPWQGKFCDFKGFKGDDFRSYGVIGTPTFYIIDNGIIQGRYARLADTGVLSSNEL